MVNFEIVCYMFKFAIHYLILINCVCFVVVICVLWTQGECVVLRDRKLNIAPAIKKQVGENEHILLNDVNKYVFTISILLHSRYVQQMVLSTMRLHNPTRWAIFRWTNSQQSTHLVCTLLVLVLLCHLLTFWLWNNPLNVISAI